MFRSVFVANRGEIAVRIIRTLDRLAIRSVLAAAAPDRTSLAAREAAEVALLPGSSATDTYLNIQALLAAAKRSGCDALHPGYGFLSESAALARACAAAGIAFVGPSPEALELLGDKVRARDLASGLGIPVIPGWQDDSGDDSRVADAADALGFPVMLKARAGGGGRGMRRLTDAAGLLEAISGARREAVASFGDGGLFLEKLITGAHHVEVQVVGDSTGKVLHFGERDCSVQRRHQKLIEESPSPAVDERLRARLTTDAVRLCEAAGYRNAGTVEFLVGAPATNGERPYYLLEVNPRLQVEHPVTEAVTGVDLVELQLKVAAGEPLGFAQPDIELSGHAIELRTNAESPGRGFEPSPGRVARLSLPGDARVDAGYADGDSIPAQFDSLFAKLIVHAPDRARACAAARAALTRFELVGVASNATLLDRILAANSFAGGHATIDWLDANLDRLLAQGTPPPGIIAAAAATLAAPAVETPFGSARWIGAGPATIWLWDGETTHETALDLDAAGCGSVTIGATSVGIRGMAPGSVLADDRRHPVSLSGSQVIVESPDGPFHFALVPAPPLPRTMRPSVAAGAQLVTAPLAGTVAVVHVAPEQAVSAGDVLVTLEAMKMEHRITADSDARVASVLTTDGAVVARGDPLIELTPAP